jgi:hypothetical protein
MIDFEALPLVEFVPSPNIPHKRVVECLRMDPPDDPSAARGQQAKRGGGYGGGDGWREDNRGDEQTLTFQHQDEDGANDMFT